MYYMPYILTPVTLSYIVIYYQYKRGVPLHCNYHLLPVREGEYIEVQQQFTTTCECIIIHYIYINFHSVVNRKNHLLSTFIIPSILFNLNVFIIIISLKSFKTLSYKHILSKIKEIVYRKTISQHIKLLKIIQSI